MNSTVSSIIDLFGSDASFKQLAKGAYIFHEGQSIDKVFMVVDGRVKLVHTQDHHNRNFVMHIIYAGEFLGIGEFTTRKKVRQLSAIAIDKDVTVLKIPYFKFEMEVRKNQQLVFSILQQLAKKQENLWMRYCRRRHLSTTETVMSALMDIACERGLEKEGGIAIQGIPHHDLAGYVGICRQSTTSALNTLRKENRISYTRNEILIMHTRNDLDHETNCEKVNQKSYVL